MNLENKTAEVADLKILWVYGVVAMRPFFAFISQWVLHTITWPTSDLLKLYFE